MYNWINGAVITAAKLNPAVVSKVVGDSPYTASLDDDIILCDCTGGAITINLPTAVGNTKKYEIKKTDSSTNTVTVDGNDSETIDGSLTQVIPIQNMSLSLQSNSANWFISPNTNSNILTDIYTGNGTENRAISHTRAIKPKFLMNMAYSAADEIHCWINGMGTTRVDFAGMGTRTVTEPTTTNLYVGTATPFYGNVSGRLYAYIAIF